MVNRFKEFGKIALTFAASAVLAGCSASSHNMTYQDADSLLSGYSSSAYGYGYDSGHSNYGYDYNSGYADVNMTSSEPPVIVLPPEPAPEPPVYTPPPVQEFWPEPATPVKRWTPPRK